MGEKEEIKNDGEKKVAEEGEKKAAEGGEIKAVEPITIVLKMDLHCEGCAKKVRRSVNHFEGVKKVKVDCATNKLIVTGNVDPTWLCERVESKTKKKVNLISSQPKKEVSAITDGSDGNKKAEHKSEKNEKKKDDAKKDDDKKSKEPILLTVVMKVRLHCDGCAHKIKKTILKNIDGVNVVDTNLEKNLVTVIGTMDVKKLTTYLKEKLQRGVEIVPPNKDDEGGDEKAKDCGKENKEKGRDGGVHGDTKEKEKKSSGEKKEEETKPVGSAEGTKGVEGTKVEINKLAIHTFNPQTHYVVPMNNQNYVETHQNYNMQMYQNQRYPSSNTEYVLQYPYIHESSSHTGHMIPYPQSEYMPYHTYHVMDPPPPPPTYLNIDDQTFSDENPDGCSVM